MRIAICDDDRKELDSIRQSLDNYFCHSSIRVSVHEFNDPRLFLRSIEQGIPWDIVLLDICMPGVLGTDIAKRIRERHDKTEIIFLTVSRDYAVEAFSLKAAHYLLKPFTEAEFNEAFDRAITPFLKKEIKPLLLQLENGVVQKVDFKDIIYIESVGYRRVVHTLAASYEETKKTLSRLFDELEEIAPGQFIMPYRGYVINLDAVRTITSNHVKMQNGDEILIKRGDFRRLRDVFFSWSFRESRAE